MSVLRLRPAVNLTFAIAALIMACAISLSLPNRATAQTVGVCDPTAPSHCVKPDANGNIPVTGAAGGGGGGGGGATSFAQDGAGVTLTLVANTSNRVVIGTVAKTVQVYNPGSVPVQCKPGNGSATAAATDFNIPAGGLGYMIEGANADLACIGANAVTLNIVPGHLTSDALLDNSGSAIPAGTNAIGTVDMTTATVPITATAAGGPTQLIALSGTTKIHVTGYHLVCSGACSWAFVAGTGTNCATGTHYLEGAASHTMSLPANGGLSPGNGTGSILITGAGEALCFINLGAVDIAGALGYGQF